MAIASGVNLYATVAILGLAAKYLVALPEQFQSFRPIGGAVIAVTTLGQRQRKAQGPPQRPRPSSR